MNKYKIISPPQGQIAIDETPDIRDTFPYIVVERLTNGKWELFQIDNLSDIDISTQKKS